MFVRKIYQNQLSLNQAWLIIWICSISHQFLMVEESHVNLKPFLQPRFDRVPQQEIHSYSGDNFYCKRRRCYTIDSSMGVRGNDSSETANPINRLEGVQSRTRKEVLSTPTHLQFSENGSEKMQGIISGNIQPQGLLSNKLYHKYEDYLIQRNPKEEFFIFPEENKNFKSTLLAVSNKFDDVDGVEPSLHLEKFDAALQEKSHDGGLAGVLPSSIHEKRENQSITRPKENENRDEVLPVILPKNNGFLLGNCQKYTTVDGQEKAFEDEFCESKKKNLKKKNVLSGQIAVLNNRLLSGQISTNEEFKNKDIITILWEYEKLSKLRDFVSDFEVADLLGPNQKLLKKIRMTLFLPSNAAMMNIDSKEILEVFENLEKKDYGKKIVNNHLTVGNQLDPKKLVSGQPVVVKARGHQTEIKVEILENGDIWINNRARVIEILKAKNGFIYLIDRILSPMYNDAPTLSEYISSHPELSITKDLMQHSSIMRRYVDVGPLTVFLFPDKAFKKSNGEPIDKCVWDAMKQPENQKLLDRILAHTAVANVYSLEELSIMKTIRPLSGEEFSVSYFNLSNRDPKKRRKIYLDETPIISYDIPIYNGVVHFLEKAVFFKNSDIRKAAYWTCLDDYLRSHPHLVRQGLHRVDNYHSLPQLGRPPGPRPYWVAQWSRKWEPPSETIHYSQYSMR